MRRNGLSHAFQTLRYPISSCVPPASSRAYAATDRPTPARILPDGPVVADRGLSVRLATPCARH